MRRAIGLIVAAAAVALLGALMIGDATTPTDTVAPGSDEPQSLAPSVQARSPSPTSPRVRPTPGALEPGAAVPEIVDDAFAADYALALKQAKLSPEQDREVRRVLADVQFALEVADREGLRFMIDEGKLTHLAQARRLRANPKSLPSETAHHERESDRISNEAIAVDREYRAQVFAEADRALQDAMTDDQYRRFRTVIWVEDLLTVRPFETTTR